MVKGTKDCNGKGNQDGNEGQQGWIIGKRNQEWILSVSIELK